MFSFFNKNTIPNAPESAAAKPKKAAQTQKVKIVLLALLVAITISATISYFAHLKLVVEVRKQQMSELTQQRATLAADNVRAWVGSKQSELLKFSSRPLLKNMLSGKSVENLPVLVEQLKNNVEGILAVRIFKPGQAELEPNSYPPIRYSELAMIASATRGDIVPPEFARIDNKWLLNFVLAVPGENEGESLGTVLTTFDVAQLEQSISRSFQGKVKIVLVQQVDKASAVNTLQLGEGGSGISAVAEVPASWWRIEVEAAPELEEETLIQSSFIYSMLGALSITLILIAYLLGRFIGGRLDKSGKTLTKGIGDLVATTVKKETYVDPLYQQKDILDITIKEKDEALLGLEEETRPSVKRPKVQAENNDDKEAGSVPDEIFRAYDIRGIARTQLTKELATKIGQAIGSEALDNNEHTLVVARDARIHSPELAEYLIRGILKSGCNVLNIGTVPTPILYFATETLSESRSGVMVTASHNPADYNGFKIVINGVCRSEEDIKAIRSRILSKNVHEGQGTESRKDIVPAYIDTIFSDVALAGDISIVLDAGNGVTGIVAPRLFEELGCQVTPLFCDLDGTFPNHDPDPSVPQNLHALIDKVKEVRADLGVAFDGDGDRIVVVTGSGEIIWPDRLLMLFAKDIISRNPGSDVVFDVKSTRHLVQTITSYGGRPIMWKTGHSPMKSKISETGALLGGEFSGHIFIKDRWYGFDDGLYAAARLLEIITLQGENLDEIMEEFPVSPITPEIRVKVKEEHKFMIMEKLVKEGDFGDAKVTHIDGIRAEYKYGWGLIRASNTSPNLTMRFEADDDDALHKLKSIFVKELRKIDPAIQVEWE